MSNNSAISVASANVARKFGWQFKKVDIALNIDECTYLELVGLRWHVSSLQKAGYAGKSKLITMNAPANAEVLVKLSVKQVLQAGIFVACEAMVAQEDPIAEVGTDIWRARDTLSNKLHAIRNSVIGLK